MSKILFLYLLFGIQSSHYDSPHLEKNRKTQGKLICLANDRSKYSINNDPINNHCRMEEIPDFYYNAEAAVPSVDMYNTIDKEGAGKHRQGVSSGLGEKKPNDFTGCYETNSFTDGTKKSKLEADDIKTNLDKKISFPDEIPILDHLLYIKESFITAFILDNFAINLIR